MARISHAHGILAFIKPFFEDHAALQRVACNRIKSRFLPRRNITEYLRGNILFLCYDVV